MRIAAYNIENLFDRPRAMNLNTWQDGKPILEKFAKLNALLGETTYSAAARTKMANLMIELGLERSDEAKFVILRRNKGGLLKRPNGGGIQIIANERADWVGSLELREEPIDENSMRNTARVLSELDADVVGVIEAESRPALRDFNKLILPAVEGTPFRHVMLIDGNDTRGIDVGLLCREGYPIASMRSHVDDQMPNGENLFSRDCPEYVVETPKGNRLVILVNHFKSKGFGTPAQSDARRKVQAQRVAEIYKGLIDADEQYVAVVGDLNDTPDSDPLKPLLANSTLRDAFSHSAFDDGGYPGTYGSCSEANKIDYLLLSPALMAKVTKGGVIRKGMWPGVRPKKWDVYPELQDKRDAASDHAAVWVDVDI
ncbi:endonuclease/exonuclease/phosphatase family protein [Bradyrhizobium icense]|uniref:Endonuclease/exonuclease/phosphatase n=1 Tax=Bradyrhizobium icense TaxID=1274631 RepID=A0A1B1UAN0_9BRAD|nr:endonuclease/exonuclease/phosphatase family protein [Bradyrhizobium icense]ANV99811.1 endonuclease/exonuclease/phosphatase [Bradyrhizobium icense]